VSDYLIEWIILLTEWVRNKGDIPWDIAFVTIALIYFLYVIFSIFVVYFLQKKNMRLREQISAIRVFD